MLTELVPTQSSQGNADEYIQLLKECGLDQKAKVVALAGRHVLITWEKMLAYCDREAQKALPRRCSRSGHSFYRWDGPAEARRPARYGMRYSLFFNPDYFVSAIDFDLLEDYAGLIPATCLQKIAEAKGCFDQILVGRHTTGIEQRPVPVPDPIAFGYVPRAGGLFFISQWDNDLLLDDLL